MITENENQEIAKEEKSVSKRRIVTEVLIYLVLIVLAVCVVPKYVLQRTVVDGESMENTLNDGESLLVEKISKYFTDPKRYDIIIFDPPDSIEPDDVYYVKRVFGLPGEIIQIKDNSIYINGKIIDDPYEKMPMEEYMNETASEPITLGEDEFFVLGDNRAVSVDSRDASLGTIKRDMLIGRSLIRVWPLNKFGVPD